MTIPTSSLCEYRTTNRKAALAEVSTSFEVRALIADHLGVDVEEVTDEAHFAHDLGADWFDRLELMMAVEDQFADVEIADADRISVVGDLIRHVESIAGPTTRLVPHCRQNAARPQHKVRRRTRRYVKGGKLFRAASR